MVKTLPLVLAALCLSSVDNAQDTASEALKRGNAALEQEKFDRAITEFTEAIRLDPKNAAAYNARGLARWKKDAAEEHFGRSVHEASADFSKAIELDPDQAQYYVNRAAATSPYKTTGIDDCTAAIRLNPHLAEAFRMRGSIRSHRALATKHHIRLLGSPIEDAQDFPVDDVDHEFRLALADFDEAIRLDPKTARTYFQRGKVLQELNELDKAIADFSHIILLDSKDIDSPMFIESYLSRAAIYSKQKDFDRAIQDYSEFLRMYPKSFVALDYRGQCWEQTGNYAAAIADYTETIRIVPDHPTFLNARARVYATCPDDNVRDGAKAVKDAERAVELTGGKHAPFLNTLAAAYAETDDYNKAVETINKAIELQKDEDALEEYKARLSLYRQHKPYRVPAKK